MKKIVMAIAAVMVLSLSLLVGCGGSAPETLEGTTWEITEYVIEGQKMDINALTQLAGTEAPALKFENGMVSISGLGSMGSTAYTYENGKLTIEGETVDVTGNTIHVGFGNSSMTLTKK